MGRLEDPEFSIRTALVVTSYPGASAADVADLVTNEIERAAQQIKGFERVRSISQPGISYVFVDLEDELPVNEMPTSWQELRNKVALAKLKLPPEALPSVVKDDFGDVFGIVLALSGEGYSDSELIDRAKELQKELLLVDQVRRVELWGVPEERIEVEISQAQMTELNVHPLAVVLALQGQNLSVDSGSMSLGQEKIRIAPGGEFKTIEEIENLILPDAPVETLVAESQGTLGLQGLKGITSSGAVKEKSGRQIRLRDIAKVRRVSNEEPQQIMRSNGKKAIGLALSPVPNGNVVRMGELISKRLKELTSQWPVGFQVDVISYQPDNVVTAIHGFTKNLREAVIIVTFVVMLAMGLRSGLLITSSLLVVMLGTFCVLAPMGIVLHRSSLGAFIVALGILVDDAVVVGDLILVRMQRGMDRTTACIEGANRASHQLLGATIVGALAFWPIYLTPDATGQYAGSVFIVLAVSLAISWFVAMMQTPVVYYLFVKTEGQPGFLRRWGAKLGLCRASSQKSEKESRDPHAGPVYQGYRRLLEMVLHHKTLTLSCMVILLCLACYGFTFIPQIFFPRAQRAQFMIDYWLPEGASVQSVASNTEKLEEYLLGLDGVTGVGSFLGAGPPRFYLPYEPELPNSCYAQFVVNTTSIDEVDRLLPEVSRWLTEHMPEAESRVQRFALGPTTKQEVELRISGPDANELRRLAEEAKDIFRGEAHATLVRDDWRQLIPTWAPEFSQSKGARALVNRGELSFALRWATRGIPVATFGENERVLPILVRSVPEERRSTSVISNAPVWGHSLESVPLSQVTENTEIVWEEGHIQRRNRIPTITVGADAKDGTDWSHLMKSLKPKIAGMTLPPGYSMEWGGQYEKSRTATKALLGRLPIALIFMLVIVVALFNHTRQPLIIILTFPLALIGITFGMLLLRMPFGFMALIGAMSLLGMMVRNGVVLMDQIDEELAKGEDPYTAVVTASVERMRPVTVAATTVIVGMIPLLRDPLFDSMATAIMFGLIFATILTLFVVPIFYMLFFRIKLPPKAHES